jgi:hypothetical protein
MRVPKNLHRVSVSTAYRQSQVTLSLSDGQPSVLNHQYLISDLTQPLSVTGEVSLYETLPC